jgi:hypothetical protein
MKKSISIVCLLALFSFLSVYSQEKSNRPLIFKPLSPQEMVAHRNTVGDGSTLTKNVLSRIMKSDKSKIFQNYQTTPLAFSTKNNAGAKRMKLATTPDGTELWGVVISSQDWDDQPLMGVYSLKAESSPTFNSVYLNTFLGLNGGGAFYDNELHGIYYFNAWGTTIIYYMEYSTEDWEETDRSEDTPPESSCPVALTNAYDPTTGLMVGEYYTADGSAYQLGTYDYSNYASTKIADCDTLLLATAISKTGTVYSISEGGNLFKVNKNTGALTLVGATGVHPGKYLQSAAIDRNTGKMYWAACFNDKTSALYEVDLTTGSASLIGNFPNSQEVSILYIPFRPVADAPGKVTNLKAKFDKGSLSGNVSFTMPTLTYSGSTLTGDVNYAVMSRGDTLAAGKAQAGESINVPVTVKVSGMTKIIVVAYNTSGEGESENTQLWVGNDKPQPVANLKANVNVNNGLAKVTWSPVGSIGVNNSYVDSANVKYTVIRNSTDTVAKDIADTTFSETLPNVKLTSYNYTVIATANGLESEEATSNNVVFGPPANVPVTWAFNSQSDFNIFTAIDNNNDGWSWEWNSRYKCARCAYNVRMDNDEYLLTPPVNLSSDYLYSVSFTERCQYVGDYHYLTLGYLGGDTDYKNFTTIMPRTEYNNDAFTKVENNFSVPSTGVYRLSFYENCPKDHSYFYLDNIIIDKMKLTAPDSVTALTVTPADKGLLKATISFTAPTTNLKGDKLDNITKIVICRDGVKNVITTISNPTPGQKLSYTDESAKLTNKDHTYTVIPYNNDGIGMKAEKTAFIGQDVPAAPTDVLLTDNNNGTGNLSWKAPTTGKNGKYINPDNLYYTIYDVDPTQTKIKGVAVDSMKANSLAIDTIPMTGDQHLLYYVVTAKISGVGESSQGISNFIVAGKPYELPFSESFPMMKFENPFWISSHTGSSNWGLDGDISYDDDNGSAYYMPSNTNDTGTLSSGKLNIKGASDPTLVFRYYAMPGYNADLKVVVYNGTQSVDTIKDIDYNEDTGDLGWRTVSLKLNNYETAPFVRVGFVAASHAAGVYVAIDGVEVYDVKSKDLKASITSIPQKITAGDNADIKVKITNVGSSDLDKGIVKLFVNGQMTEVKGCHNIKAFNDTTCSFSYKTSVKDPKNIKVFALVVSSYDENIHNDTTKTMIMQKMSPKVPAVNDLTASLQGYSTTLNWSAPSQDSLIVTDDFEDYDPFTTDNIGKWSTLDGDNAANAEIWANNQMIFFKHEGNPFAYIVFNPTEANIDTTMTGYGTFAAHSGDQYLASFKPAYYYTANDDWLISPALSGNKQTVKFFAKAFVTYYAEKFEVPYSTNSTDTADFKNMALSEQTVSSDQWTEYNVDLPDGAKYFAIHNVGNNGFMFMVDDVTYMPKSGVIKGYNIYRDGELIAFVEGENTTYVDASSNSGSHNYNVSVVYEDDESAFSNTATVYVPTSININGTSASNVLGEKGHIVITNCEGKNISVYAPDGSLVYNGLGKQNMVIAVKQNMYIVKVNNKSFRITVK